MVWHFFSQCKKLVICGSGKGTAGVMPVLAHISDGREKDR